MTLPARLMRLLSDMAEAEREERWEDAEVVRDGRSVWLGCEPVPGRDLDALIALTALSNSGEEKGLERFVLNGTGRALLRRPQLREALVKALRAGDPFTIENDEVVCLSERPGP